MIRGVRLARLPDGLEFPSELKAKISYAADQGQLQFQGFMSKTDFDKLVRLHNDLAYQRALEQLFQLCTFPAADPPDLGRSKSLVFSGLAAAGLVTTIVVVFVLWSMFRSPSDHGGTGGNDAEVRAANMQIAPEVATGDSTSGNHLVTYHLTSTPADDVPKDKGKDRVAPERSGR